MDTLLVAHWLSGLAATSILDEASVALARRDVRALATQVGMAPSASGSLVNIVSELAHNQLAHARDGHIAMRAVERDGVSGVEIIAADGGGGIEDPSTALAGAARSMGRADEAKRSLGIGLAAVLELADETDFDVRVGEGTCVRARKFGTSVRRRREVGIYGRPIPGEPVSGDHAGFVRADENLLVALVDGLGHGPDARKAADIAIAQLCARPTAALDAMLDDCHLALHKSRGAVGGVARVHEEHTELEAAGVGNVTLQVVDIQGARRVMGSSRVLGAPGPWRSPKRELLPIGSREVLILFSDGLSSRVDMSQHAELLREHPIVIASQLVQRFARNTDDVLVLVAR
jgi:anti-sigma regulatory factor (Ser/Thr protein kinase)